MRYLNEAAALLLLVCLLFFSGCGEGGKSVEDMQNSWNNSNMERIITLYKVHQLSHIGRGPKDEGKFKEYISSLDEATLAKYRVDLGQLDQLFVSERDSEPFEIRYRLRADDRGSGVGVVFERVGVDGVRKVGFNTRKIIDVDNEQDYQDLLAGKQLVGAGN